MKAPQWYVGQVSDTTMLPIAAALFGQYFLFFYLFSATNSCKLKAPQKGLLILSKHKNELL